MSRTIWPIKGTQVRTLTWLFVRLMSVHSRAYPRMHHISPGVSFPGAKRYTPWAGEESLDPRSAVATICSQILGEKVTPRASADYSLSLIYSLLLYGCANEDYHIHLPCAFFAVVVGWLVWLCHNPEQQSLLQRRCSEIYGKSHVIWVEIPCSIFLVFSLECCVMRLKIFPCQSIDFNEWTHIYLVMFYYHSPTIGYVAAGNFCALTEFFFLLDGRQSRCKHMLMLNGGVPTSDP